MRIVNKFLAPSSKFIRRKSQNWRFAMLAINNGLNFLATVWSYRPFLIRVHLYSSVMQKTSNEKTPTKTSKSFVGTTLERIFFAHKYHQVERRVASWYLYWSFNFSSSFDSELKWLLLFIVLIQFSAILCTQKRARFAWIKYEWTFPLLVLMWAFSFIE